jgi:hypothetical protein
MASTANKNLILRPTARAARTTTRENGSTSTFGRQQANFEPEPFYFHGSLSKDEAAAPAADYAGEAPVDA